MHVSISRTAEKLESDGLKVIEFFETLSPEQIDVVLYETELDTWRVKDVLAHLTFAEQAFLEIFKNILRGGNGASQDVVVDDYNFEKMKLYKTVPISAIIAEYRETRANTLMFVDGLIGEDLERTGYHPALGVTTLLEMIKMIYLHTQMHMRDVKKTVSG